MRAYRFYIFHEDGNDVLGADAARGEKTSRRLDTPQEVCVGDALIFEYDGEPVRRARSVVAYETRQVHHDLTINTIVADLDSALR